MEFSIMTHEEALALKKKYTFLVGNDLTYCGTSYTVTRLQVLKKSTEAALEIVLKGTEELTWLTADFNAFYFEWSGNRLTSVAA